MASEQTSNDDPRTEQPEEKDLQDHTFGKAMQEREAEAERGEEDPGEEPAMGAGGKA